MLEKASEGVVRVAEVDRDELRALLERIAGPSGSVPERIGRVARELSWNFRRAKAHWYREAHRIDENEMRAARKRAEETDNAELDAQISHLRSRIRVLEIRLANTDEEFHSAEIAGLRHATDRRRRVD